MTELQRKLEARFLQEASVAVKRGLDFLFDGLLDATERIGGLEDRVTLIEESSAPTEDSTLGAAGAGEASQPLAKWERELLARDSALFRHAQRELELANVDVGLADSLLDAVAALASYGHSWGSAGWAIETLGLLLRYMPLSPLTDNPAEWNEVLPSDMPDGPLWQSNRQSSAFSTDGGKTYYSVDDKDRVRHPTEHVAVEQAGAVCLCGQAGCTGLVPRDAQDGSAVCPSVAAG